MKKYLCMSGADLGLNPLVCEDTKTIVLHQMVTASQHEPLSLSLDLMPLAAQESLMGAGTSCHWRIGYTLYSFSLEDQTSCSLKLTIRTLGPDSCTML